MILSFDLLFEAVFGILLGCFYAAVSWTVVSSDARRAERRAPGDHGARLVLPVGSVAGWGLDPIVAGVVLMPAFFVLGVLLYRFYYESSRSAAPKPA